MKTNRKNIMNFITSLLIMASAGGAMLAMAVPQTVAAQASDPCDKGFLGFPPWYRGLTVGSPSCSIASPTDIPQFIWAIALNVIEMVLVAVAYVAGFYILYGGFLFLTSQGKVDSAAKARTAILNAVIGLIIAMMAVAIVEFIVKGITN